MAASFEEIRSIASDLLLCSSRNDKDGFDVAMLRAEGHIPHLLYALCGIANKAMASGMTAEERETRLTGYAAEVPAPVLDVTDGWLDAIALLEAVGRRDMEGAKAVLAGNMDVRVLLGCVVQAVAPLLTVFPEEDLAGYFDSLRVSEPPEV